MLTVPVRELKSKLSDYLHKVVDGEDVFITKKGKIIAKIVASDQNEAWEDKRKRLAGSLLFYKDPTEPVGEDDWEALRDNT